MFDPAPEVDYLQYDHGQAVAIRKPVIAEEAWKLYVNQRELVTFLCTPCDLHYLALGFLDAEGLIGRLEDVLSLRIYEDEHRCYCYVPAIGLDATLVMAICPESVGAIDARLRGNPLANLGPKILTSGCGGGVTFDDLSRGQPRVESDLTVTPSQVQGLMNQLLEQAGLYHQSRGVHASALADGDQLLFIAEDVGRHNTLDKLRGRALKQGIPTQGRILLSTGRISSEMITKAARMGVPVVVSRTSPTVLSVHLARSWGIMLVGYMRGQRMSVYSGQERLLVEALE
jgi:FdhD protein